MKDTLARLYKRSAYFLDAFIASDLLSSHERNELAARRQQAADLSEFYRISAQYSFNRSTARDIFNQLSDLFILLNELASFEEREHTIFASAIKDIDKILEGFDSKFEEIESALNTACANLISDAELTNHPEPENSFYNSTFNALYSYDTLKNSNVPEISTTITSIERETEYQSDSNVEDMPISQHLTLYKDTIQLNIELLKSIKEDDEGIEICNNILSHLDESTSEGLNIESIILLLDDFVKARQISENLSYLTQAFSQYLKERLQSSYTINDPEISEESFDLSNSPDDASLNTDPAALTSITSNIALPTGIASIDPPFSAHDILGMSWSSLGRQPGHTANPIGNVGGWTLPEQIRIEGDETLGKAIKRIIATRPTAPPVVDTTVQTPITTSISGFLHSETSHEKKRKLNAGHLFYSNVDSNNSSENYYSSSSDDESDLDPSDDESSDSDNKSRNIKSPRL